MNLATIDRETAVSLRQALVFLAVCIIAAVLASVLRPTTEISTFPNRSLEKSIPDSFGDWHVDASTVPLLPDPSTLAAINRIYSETVARTYVNSQGERVMLSLAYGRRQNDTMRLHEPEGCYTGQGFGVRRLGQQLVTVDGRAVPVMRLHATMGGRDEPITYWMVVGGGRAITQTEAKLAQLRFGLRGFVPDGLLVRVSSITKDSAAGFAIQDAFVRDLAASVPSEIRSGLMGS